MTISRLFEILEYQRTHYPQKDAMAFKHQGSWEMISIDELIAQVNQISYGLIKLGVGVGDKVALVSPNRPEWILMDYAIQQIGAVSVPIYPTITINDYKYILKDSSTCLVLVDGHGLYDRVNQAAKELESVRFGIYSFDEVPGVPNWRQLFDEGNAEIHEQVDSIKSSIAEDDLVTIIYTSGTTGNPKGVMLTHKNIMSNTKAVSEIFPIEGFKARTLSILPLCHIFERTASFMAHYLGISQYFAESLDTIGENIREVKPHYFSAVPRLLEKTYEKIVDKGMDLSGVKKSLFEWSMKLGQRYDLPEKKNIWYGLQLWLANKLVFKKWREALGGNLQFVVSGAAALHSGIARVFWAANIPILEAYGLTEASPGVTFTRLNYGTARIGCVGYPLGGVSVKIAEDGEVLVKGPNVMKGYYGRPDLTQQTINAQGWLHTGDIGQLLENNLLKITDRKKEIFKTSGGKYIAPQLLENAFKNSPFIDQMMVVGEGEKFPAALIVPSFERLMNWAKAQDIHYDSPQQLLEDPKVLEFYGTIVDDQNDHFAKYEQVKKFYLVPQEWSVESGELTPTLKLKRRIILDRYHSQIQSFYR